MRNRGQIRQLCLLALGAFPLGGCTLVFAVVQPQAGLPVATLPGAATADVPLVVDASTSVVSVSGEVVDASNSQVATMTLVNAGPAPASRHQNSNEWRATQALPPGSYVFRAVGTASQGTSPSTSRAEAAFSVTSTVATPAVTLSLTSPAGDILVPRGGSATLNLSVGQTATTGPVALSATGLPAGVTLSPASPQVAVGAGSSPLPATLSATPTATGSGTARLVAQSAGARDAVVSRTVRVVPADGAITFRQAPFLSGNGPQAVTSADGAWRMTASRTGLSRVWTLRIQRIANPNDVLDVTMATWGGAGGSNLGGLLFCPGSPTTTALVLSDNDESDPPLAGRQGVTYQAKVIRLGATGAPQLSGQLDGLKFQNAVQPQLGFSGDCSIVGTWSISPIVATERQVSFANGLSTGASFGGWTFADSGQTAAPTFSARLTAGTLVLTAPGGQTRSAQVP
jgi:hypothetical protein